MAEYNQQNFRFKNIFSEIRFCQGLLTQNENLPRPHPEWPLSPVPVETTMRGLNTFT